MKHQKRQKKQRRSERSLGEFCVKAVKIFVNIIRKKYKNKRINVSYKTEKLEVPKPDRVAQAPDKICRRRYGSNPEKYQKTNDYN